MRTPSPIFAPKASIYRQRPRVAFLLIAVLFLVLAGRMIILQAVDLDGNAQRARSQRLVEETLAANRGRILDAKGDVLAQSILSYDIVVDQQNNAVPQFDRVNPQTGAKETLSREQGLRELAQTLDLPFTYVADAATGTARYRRLAENVNPGLEEKLAALRVPGVAAVANPQRLYPMGPVGGNVVGFKTKDGAGSGIESTQDQLLTGTDGKRIYQVGRDGVVIPNAGMERQEPVNGKDVRLTLDTTIQYFAENLIKEEVKKESAEWGTIVVIETKTGNVLAMAQDDTVDPNNPGGKPAPSRDSRAVTNVVEPGSTVKALTAAGLIDRGLITPETRMTIPHTYTIDGQTFKDVLEHGTIRRTFAGVLGDSLNTGTVMAGSKLTVQQRYDNLRAFGLGKKTGIPLPGESAGLLRTPDKWDGRSKYAVLFGQSLAAPPFQMAMTSQVLANSGIKLAPRLIDAVIGPDGKEEKMPQQEGERVIKPETASSVRDILESVVNQRWTGANIPGYRVGGKSGTSEYFGPDGQFAGTVASFIGMAPMDDPQYVVGITVKHPQKDIYGSSQATIFSKMMAQVLRAKGVPPSKGEPVKLPME